MTKRALISWNELHYLCEAYKDDYIRHSLARAENNLELWFLGSKEIEDEKSTD